MKKVLLVIIPDALSQLVNKGEIVANYYNPGGLFEEVHILTMNDDRVDPKYVQKMVGTARLFVHNLGKISFKRTLAWRSFLLEPLAQRALALAREIRPLLLRTHGDFINGHIAVQIKKYLGIPLVVSLHINPDEDLRGRLSWLTSFRDRFYYEMLKPFEKETMRFADCVIPVYEPIREYALCYGAKRIEVIYNIVNSPHLRKKESYALPSVPRIISVGRQFKEKNPDNLIRAVAETDAVLTLVGDGEYHHYLRSVAEKCGVSDRVTFLPSMPNDKLCRMLADFDIFAVHSEYWEISKSLIEAMLTGLPVIINLREGKPVPELQGDWVVSVKNTKEEYRNAINSLLIDSSFRESLGKECLHYAWEHFAPEAMEQKIIALYKELVPCL